MKRWRGGRSSAQWYAGVFLVFVTVLCAGTWPALGADLQLRESLLQAQRDRVTATITAVVDHIGTSAHPISNDCDLHVPLRSRDINVPFIGEVKNACSEIPQGASQAHWSDRIYEETHGRAVTVAGAFRIWLEHPPAGAAVQTEADRVPWYPNSNPDHQVELHPVTQIGALDFLGHVKRIRRGAQTFTGYGPPQLTTVIKKKLTIQRRQVGGVAFVRLVGTKTGNNHWDLRGRVVGAPESLADGTRIRLDILQGNQVVPGAVGISAVAIAGTAAHTAAQALANGDVVTFQALIRMHLPTLLDQVSDTAAEITLPVEFVLLAVE
jgi:hypothetical protein